MQAVPVSVANQLLTHIKVSTFKIITWKRSTNCSRRRCSVQLLSCIQSRRLGTTVNCCFHATSAAYPPTLQPGMRHTACKPCPPTGQSPRYLSTKARRRRGATSQLPPTDTTRRRQGAVDSEPGALGGLRLTSNTLVCRD